MIASDSDDDDSAPYNPKNLPLGWDGKVWSNEFFADHFILIIAHTILVIQVTRAQH